MQFSTAAVHAAEEQHKASSKEAKHQELFPSLPPAVQARPAQASGETLNLLEEVVVCAVSCLLFVAQAKPAQSSPFGETWNLLTILCTVFLAIVYRTSQACAVKSVQ